MYIRKGSKFGDINDNRNDGLQCERKSSNQIALESYKNKRTLCRERNTARIRSLGFLPDVNLRLLGLFLAFI